MAPRVDPVRSDHAPPARADVVIVGGGIIGTSTALFLAEKGVSVALCEKGHIAGEQSSRNWGWCRKMGRDPREIPLIIESLRLWQGMNQRVEGETGFRQCGIMYLAENPAELAQLESWLDHARQYQLDTRLLTLAEARDLMPGMTGNWAGALYTPSDGKAEPQRGAPAIAEMARRRGAAIVTQCAVRGLDTAAGRISAVVTEKGEIACGSVVLAGGAWSRLFCGNLGIELPQLKVLASVMRTEPIEGGPEISASGGLFGFRKRMDGCFAIICRPRGCIGKNCASGSASAGLRNGGCRGAGHWISRRRLRPCVSSTPSPTSLSWIAPKPRSARPFRCFARWSWRRAGAG